MLLKSHSYFYPTSHKLLRDACSQEILSRTAELHFCSKTEAFRQMLFPHSVACGKVCPGCGPGQPALADPAQAGLGLGGLQRSRPLEQGGISRFLLKGLPMCVAFLMLGSFYVGKFLHFFAFLVSSLLSDKGMLCILCTIYSRYRLEDPLGFQAIIMVCFSLCFSKIPHFSSLQVREICWQ